MKFFKQIPDFPNYVIFRNGVVYRIADGHTPAFFLHKKQNNLRVDLRYNGHRKNIIVKKVVAKLFLPGPAMKNILHKDFNPENVHYTNLYYTNKQRHNGGNGGVRGEAKSKKLKNEDVAYILLSDYPVKRLSKMFNISHVYVVLIKQGKRWQHIHELPLSAKEALAKNVKIYEINEFSQTEVTKNIFSRKGVRKIIKAKEIDRKKVPIKIDSKTTIFVLPENVKKTKLKYNLL